MTLKPTETAIACLHSMSLPGDTVAQKADKGPEVIFLLRRQPNTLLNSRCCVVLFMLAAIDLIETPTRGFNRASAKKTTLGGNKGSSTFACSWERLRGSASGSNRFIKGKLVRVHCATLKFELTRV